MYVHSIYHVEALLYMAASKISERMVSSCIQTYALINSYLGRLCYVVLHILMFVG